MTQQTLHAPDTVAHDGFRVTLNPAARSERDRAAVLAAPGFGAHFTDHMVLVDFSERNGWHDRRVVPYGPLPMDPAATALQYGQEIFEGLKLYRHRDGHLRLFRPDMNARRFAASAARLALPAVPTGLFVESIRQLALVDAAWVPDRPGDSLYVRPFVIGTEALLGVRPARHATYGVIASPAGSYFDDAESGISLWLSPSHSRAGAGGTGAAKCGGNYAAALVAQTEAKAHGCQQVLFTDAATRTWVEEAGSMNIFFVFADGTLVTPPLNGAILAGVTRDSVIELARDRGHRVEERPISIAEWKAAAATGELTEVFAAGTAAVITPIAELVTEDTVIATRASGSASMARELRAQLTGIQHGTIPDRRGWLLDLGPARR